MVFLLRRLNLSCEGVLNRFGFEGAVLGRMLWDGSRLMSDKGTRMLPFSRIAAMSRAFRAFTRSCLLWRAVPSGPFLIEIDCLPAVWPGIAVARTFFSLGGGDGLGMKSGTSGLSGTSGSLRVGAGEGILGVCPLICSIPAELYPWAVSAVP